MLSQLHVHGKSVTCRWSTLQPPARAAGGVVRPGVARRVVAERASGFRSSEDVDTLAAVAAASRQRVQRSAAFDHDNDVVTVDAAALRDRTASASTSGHDHPASGARRAVVAGAARRTSSASARSSRQAAAESVAAPEHDAEHAGELGHEHHTAPADATTALHVNGVAAASAAVADAHLAAQPAAAAAVGDADAAATEKANAPAHKRGLSRPPGLTEARDRETHEELRACDDWRDVLDVVADEAAVEGLSARTCVQALTKLNTLTRNSPGERAELIALPAFAALTKLVMDQVHDMNNVQLSNSLWAFSQLGVRLPAADLDAYWAACLDAAELFYPRDIATLLAAAAAGLRAAPPQRLLDVMGFRARGFLSSGQFEARGISTLLHSAVVLGYINPLLGWAAAEAVAAPGVMAAMAPQGVANTMWALGRMGVYHPPAVEAALAAFRASSPAYKPQEVANLLWALTAFRHHPGEVFADFAKSLLGRLDELRPADLATALYALAYFNTAPGRAVLTRIAGRVLTLLEQRSRARAADAEDAAEEVSSSAAAAAAAAAAGAPELAPRLRKTTRGPARHALRWRPGGVLNGVELANLYWGFALLGAEQQLEPRLAERLLGGLEAALAEEWAVAGAGAAVAGAAAGAAPEAAGSAKAEGQEGEPAAVPEAGPSGAKVAAALVAGAFPDSLQRMTFQGFLAGRLAGSSRRHAFSPLALDAFKRSWMANMTEQATRATGGRGHKTPVKHVADLIHKLKISYDTLRPTRDGLAVIDVALKAGPERYVALEVVAEADTAANSRQMLGPNAVKRQLLEKNGWEVRYLNAGDLLRMDADTQLLFVADLLKGLGLKPRGPELTAALAAMQGAAAPAAGGAAAAARAARGEAAGGAGEAEGGRRVAAGGGGRVPRRS
ncbi:hypothetical protein HYH02_005987 [Chlamydomonas schloesseri]|uniref:RAP domain-containing protein n=1 Tax=Chlamydomonas schloesseri TaxID=2026947 RepID=A0A836B6N3_9CHLO|nr:hypothetical protein HYH02_005987 [Chlamydomonas schloesseri]|eukprot:KAG2449241.1 hypothetical protein HYH02_005987 [Chlamydomonas schloesseri]